MPLVDMSVEELKTYQGRNPRPADFDSYWMKGLQEINAVDADVELIPSDFTVPYANCYDLYFTGTRGARIHAKYLRPTRTKEPHPAVLQFHGYTGRSADWSQLLNFGSLGFSVLAMDCRGQGGYSEDVGGVKGTTFRGHIIRGLDDNPDNLLFRHIFLDTVQLASIAMGFPEIDASRVGTMGGSQGGALALACASLEPKIKRVAAIYPFLCDYKRVWEMDIGGSAYEELRAYFRQFDPQHKKENEVFTSLGYIDVQHLISRVRGDVLMAVGLMDNVCPPSTQFAAFNKMTTSKHVEIYPDFGHEELPGFSDKIVTFMLGL